MAKAGKKAELVNTSEIARRSGLNRATVKTKLDSKGVRPQKEKPKEKLYDADEALGALHGDDRTGLRKAQTIKTATSAAREKLKLEKERGDLIPIKDARADLQEVVSRIFQHFAVTGPREIAPQLRGKSVSQIETTLKRNAEQFFSDLRAEYESYLSAED